MGSILKSLLIIKMEKIKAQFHFNSLEICIKQRVQNSLLPKKVLGILFFLTMLKNNQLKSLPCQWKNNLKSQILRRRKIKDQWSEASLNLIKFLKKMWKSKLKKTIVIRPLPNSARYRTAKTQPTLAHSIHLLDHLTWHHRQFNRIH